MGGFAHLIDQCPTCHNELPGMTPEARIAIRPLLKHMYSFDSLGLEAMMTETAAASLDKLPEDANSFKQIERALLATEEFKREQAVDGSLVVRAISQLGADKASLSDHLADVQRRLNNTKADYETLLTGFNRTTAELAVAKNNLADAVNRANLADALATQRNTESVSSREGFVRERERANHLSESVLALKATMANVKQSLDKALATIGGGNA